MWLIGHNSDSFNLKILILWCGTWTSTTEDPFATYSSHQLSINSTLNCDFHGAEKTLYTGWHFSLVMRMELKIFWIISTLYLHDVEKGKCFCRLSNSSRKLCAKCCNWQLISVEPETSKCSRDAALYGRSLGQLYQNFWESEIVNANEAAVYAVSSDRSSFL